MDRRLLVAPVAALAVVAAGCGGGKAPPVASLTTTTPPAATGSAAAGANTAQDRAELAACLTSHGFPAAVGAAGSTSGPQLSILGVVVEGKVDPGSPQFQAALRACREYLPAAPPPLSPAQQAAARKAMLAVASCMRQNGVPGFPDPNSRGIFPIGSISSIDPGSPLVQKAFRACESLEPKVGPRIVLGGAVAGHS